MKAIRDPIALAIPNGTVSTPNFFFPLTDELANGAPRGGRSRSLPGPAPRFTPTSLRHSYRGKLQVRMTLLRGRRRATCPGESDTTSLLAAMPGMFCQTAIFARRLDFAENARPVNRGGSRPAITTVIPYQLFRPAEPRGAAALLLGDFRNAFIGNNEILSFQ